MKHLKVFIIIGITLIFTIGCEGPAGPQGEQGEQGPPGQDGIDGIDGTDITEVACLVCHNDDRLLEKRFQLNQHDHSTFANSLSRGSRASCGRCHSHENFVSFWETGETHNLESATPLTCKSCHMLHNTDNVDDFSFELRIEGEVPFIVGGTRSFGKIFDSLEHSNLCLGCHQPRRTYADYDSTPDDATDDVTVTSSHAGPHYGVTGTFIFGEGADDRNSSSSLDQGPMAHVDVGCVGCHMGEEANHTFEPDVDRCQSCHSGAEDLDMNGMPTKMEAAIHAIAEEFVNLGFLETTDHVHYDATASSSDPNVMTGVQFSAFWNYQVLHADHGSLYHNPPYTKAIINSIEDNLGLPQTTW